MINMGKLRKNKKENSVQSVQSSRSELMRQKEEEKIVTTEVFSHPSLKDSNKIKNSESSLNSKDKKDNKRKDNERINKEESRKKLKHKSKSQLKNNITTSSRRNSMKSLESMFEMIVISNSNSFHFKEKLKVKIILNKVAEYVPHEKLLFKLYYVSNQNQRYLLTYGLKKMNKGLKLKQTLQFSARYPPSPLIHFELDLFHQNKKIRTFFSDDFIVSMTNTERAIKIHKITFLSTVLVPENPFVFWVHTNSPLLPDAISLKVHFTLLDRRLVLAEEFFPVKIGGPNANPDNIMKYPFQVMMPAMENKDKRLKVLIEIIEVENNKVIYTQNDSIPMEISLTGFKIEYIGYKRDVSLGEIAYMMGDIQNRSQYSIKGKAQFYFYTLSGDKFLCFNRKFKIQENQYEKLSEDIPLLEFLGGKEYWVVCLLKFKANGINYKIEAISEPRLACIPAQKIFFGKLRANLPKEPLKINSIVPIGIDVRVRAENQFHPLYCEIVENYENLDIRRLHRFKIKHFDVDHSNFHWKIPVHYGTYLLQVRFIYNYVQINPENIESNTLEFTIFP